MRRLFFFVIYFCATVVNANLFFDPLPSWNNGSVKKDIISFVEKVTNPSSPDYVTPNDRIATIDNDGTLWVEQPMYTEAIFSADTLQALKKLKTHLKQASVKEKSKDMKQAMMQMIAATHSGMTIEAYQQTVKSWLNTAENPHFHRRYIDCVYQPMLEVMDYLRANDFKVYIVSGGGQEFIRAFAENIYGVVPEQVIGSTLKTKFTYQNNIPVLIKLPTIQLVNNYAGKAEDINLFIGKKPLIAIGNSDGDRQMLEWTQSGAGARMMLLVHHDDAKREYAYGPNTKVGTFSDALMKEALANHWHVISMKNDWKEIFPAPSHLTH